MECADAQGVPGASRRRAACAHDVVTRCAEHAETVTGWADPPVLRSRLMLRDPIHGGGDRRPKSKVKRGTYIQDKRDTGITGVAAEMISLTGLRSRHHPRPTRPLSLSQLPVYTTAHGHTARHTARHSSTQARRPRRAKRISRIGYHTGQAHLYP